MTIGPYTSEEKKTRNAFKLLRKLKEDINSELGGHKIKELSMGMSGDFEIGVQEGSTMVRVGTGIFGARNYWKYITLLTDWNIMVLMKG